MSEEEITSSIALSAIPREQKSTLLYDANVFRELGGVLLPDGKRTYLSTIAETAKLPTVNLILIPARVAYWELRGGVMLPDPHGNLVFTRVDEDFADPTCAKGKNDAELAELFASASKYSYHNGEYRTILGTNTKIVIVESKFTHHFFKELILANGITDPVEKKRMLSWFREERDNGEDEIEYISTSAPIHNPVYIFSKDIVYLGKRKRDQVTISGYPIGTAKIIDYLVAELFARPKFWRDNFGITSIQQYMNATLRAGFYPGRIKYPDGYKETGPGKYISQPDGKLIRGEALSATFRRGAEMLAGRMPEFDFPPPMTEKKTVISPLAGLSSIFANRIRDNMQWISSVLYDYQLPMAQAIIDDLAAGNSGGTMKEPTAAGKTIVMGAVIKSLDTRTLVLVPKKSIANNTYNEFITKLGFDPADVGVYHGDMSKAERKAALSKKILITTSMSMIRLCERGLIKRGDFRYTALDEAHKMRGDVTARAIREVLLPDSIVHAWTATDQFFDGSLVGETLFGRRTHIHSTTIKQAITDGWSPDTKNIIIRTHVDIIDALPNQELSEQQQQTLASRAGRDEQALAMSYAYIDRDTGVVFSEEQSIWFCSGVDHAKLIAEKLNKLHGPGYARAVSGTSPDQADILNDHKAGKFKALINADLLIEGYNNPRCSICYMLRDSLSPIVIEQTGGRVGRLDPQNPFKFSYIVSLIDENRPYSMVYADIVENWLITSNKGILDRSPMRNREFPIKTLPPEYPPIESLDIIETDRQYVEFKRDRANQRDALLVPHKTADWLTKTDITHYLGTQYPPLLELLQKIESDYRKFRRFELEGTELQIGYRSTYKLTPFCYHISTVDLIAKHLKIDLEEKTAVWKNRTEVADLLGIGVNRIGFVRLWTELEDEFDKLGTASINGVSLIAGRKRTIDATRWKSFCVHECELEKIREGLGMKTEEWLAMHDMEAELNTSRKNKEFVALWNDLKKQNDKFNYAKIGERMINCDVRGNENHLSFCVHRSEAAFLRTHLKLNLPQKTEEWLNLKEAGHFLHTNPTASPLSRMWEAKEKELRETGKVMINDVQIRAQIMQNGSNRFFCVHKDDIHYLRKPLGLNVLEKTAEWLHKTEIMGLPKFGGKEISKLFSKLYDNLEKQFAANGFGAIDGHPIRLEYRKAGFHTLMCIHADDIIYVRKYLGIDKEIRPENWFGKNDFLHELGVNVSKDEYFARIFNDIKRAYDTNTEYFVDGFKVECGYRVCGQRTSFYVNGNCVPTMRRFHQLDLFDQGGEWMPKHYYAILLETSINDKAFQRLWQNLQDLKTEGKTPVVGGQEIKCGYKRFCENLKFYANTEHKAVLLAELDVIREIIREEKKASPEVAYAQRLDYKVVLPEQFTDPDLTPEQVHAILRNGNTIERYKLQMDMLRSEANLTYLAIGQPLDLTRETVRQWICTEDRFAKYLPGADQHKAVVAQLKSKLPESYGELIDNFDQDYARAKLMYTRQKVSARNENNEALVELGRFVKKLSSKNVLSWKAIAEQSGIENAASTLFKRVPPIEVIERIIKVIDPSKEDENKLYRLFHAAYRFRHINNPGAWAERVENNDWGKFVAKTLKDSLLPRERAAFER